MSQINHFNILIKYTISAISMKILNYMEKAGGIGHFSIRSREPKPYDSMTLVYQPVPPHRLVRNS
jgi:hypothetical protein